MWLVVVPDGVAAAAISAVFLGMSAIITALWKRLLSEIDGRVIALTSVTSILEKTTATNERLATAVKSMMDENTRKR